MRYLVILFVGLAAISSATRVNQCPGGNIENLEDLITVGKCVNPPCRLRKNTRVNTSFKFKAEDEYKNLIQTVTANIAGIAFPFIGIDGASPCSKIFEEDGTTKSNCQFTKGKTYIFKDSFDVLQIYPRVKTVVHWAITDTTTGKNAVCFEVPAVITN